MEALLIVLVAGCACIAAVRTGKSFWARSRSVERHHQALDTLADITQRTDVPAASAPPPPDGHQAHVRIIPADVTAPSLPPPRALWVGGSVRSSPLRRPSAHALPPDEVQERTLPGHLPLPPVPLDERATRPVPVTRAEVFYFDDLEAKTRRGASGNVRTPAPVDGGPGPQAAPADQLSVVDEPTVVVAPADQGPAPGLDGVGTAPIGTTPPSGRDRKRGRPGPKSVAASVLAAAAVCVALVALGLSLSSGDGAHAAGHPPAGGKASQGTTVPGRHPRPLHHKNLPKATTTSRPTTVPTTRPPTAALIATGPGTASFRLSSARLPLTLAATGACWTEVRAGGASGRLLYVGTLQAGQHYSFKAPAWARLGDPSQVSVHLGGTGLHASGLLTGDPINLRFSVG